MNFYLYSFLSYKRIYKIYNYKRILYINEYMACVSNFWEKTIFVLKLFVFNYSLLYLLDFDDFTWNKEAIDSINIIIN